MHDHAAICEVVNLVTFLQSWPLQQRSGYHECALACSVPSNIRNNATTTAFSRTTRTISNPSQPARFTVFPNSGPTQN
jgi:hypothetical protein